MDITVHPSAALFPMLDGEAFDSLVEDIGKNGLKQKIVFRFLSATAIEIIDGRNREPALRKLGCDLFPDGEPDPEYFREYDEDEDGDIDAFIVSVNLHRRHLTIEQQREAYKRKREQIAARLKADPSVQDTAIVSEVGTNKTTVKEVRRELEVKGEIPERTEIVMVDGKTRPVGKALENYRETVAALLCENPNRPNKELARTVGCSKNLIHTVRRDLVLAGKIPQVTEVIRSDGQRRPVKPIPVPAKTAKPIKPAAKQNGKPAPVAEAEAPSEAPAPVQVPTKLTAKMLRELVQDDDLAERLVAAFADLMDGRKDDTVQRALDLMFATFNSLGIRKKPLAEVKATFLQQMKGISK